MAAAAVGKGAAPRAVLVGLAARGEVQVVAAEALSREAGAAVWVGGVQRAVAMEVVW